MSIRETLLAAPQRRYHEETIDGVGPIRCQSLSAAEASQLEASYVGDSGFDPAKFAKRKPLVIALSLVDDAGNREFSDEDIEDIAQQDAAIIDAIYEVCERHINAERRGKNLSGSKATNGEGSPADLLTAAAG